MLRITPAADGDRKATGQARRAKATRLNRSIPGWPILVRSILAVRQLFPVPTARRQVQFQTSHEIQPQSWKSKSFLIFLIQKIVHLSEHLDSFRQPVSESRIQQLVAGISEEAGKPQLASKSSVVRLDVQHRAANRPVHVEHQPLLRPSRVESTRVALATQQWFSDGEGINGFRKAVQRQDRSIHPSVRT